MRFIKGKGRRFFSASDVKVRPGVPRYGVVVILAKLLGMIGFRGYNSPEHVDYKLHVP